MIRKWHKVLSPKQVQELAHCYHGNWLPQMDRCWESEDGYSVMSRLIRTEWGNVEHVTIERMTKFLPMGGVADIPWAVKQEIKNDLFGEKRCAIEVFPAEKNLVDVCDVYHLWVFAKDFSLPFGIHPIRDKQCNPVQRGYDCDLQATKEWLDSDRRKEIYGECEREKGN